MSLVMLASSIQALPRSPAQAAVPPPGIAPAQPETDFAGRFLAITLNPLNAREAIGASESGGLFRTTNLGASWTHIDTLFPSRLADVRYRPSGGAIIATTKTDPRAARISGIWISSDSGATWTEARPLVPSPACTDFGAFGIAFGPAGNAYVGTACGLAIVNVELAGYMMTDPSGPGLPKAIYAVDAAANGNTGFDIVDVCGQSGHHRSMLNGTTWAADALGLPCLDQASHALARSPFDANVIFVDHKSPASVSMSTNGGASWTSLPELPAPRKATRQYAIRTHPSTTGRPDDYDIYASNPNDFYRRTCSRTAGCAAGEWTPVETGHADVSDLVWQNGANCPLFATGDWGVSIVDVSTAAGVACGTKFKPIKSGPSGLNALQVAEVTGQVHPTGDRVTDLYFATMDNSVWASTDGGQTWPRNVCCEGIGLQVAHSGSSHDNQLVTALICGACVSRQSSDHLATVSPWNTPGTNPSVNHGEPILLPDGRYVQRAEGPGTSGASVCCFLWLSAAVDTDWTRKVFVGDSARGNFHVSGPASAPVLFGTKDTRLGTKILQIDGILGSTVTSEMGGLSLTVLGNQCLGEGAYACPFFFAVDPSDPRHLIAEDVGGDQLAVKVLFGRGGSFAVDRRLTDLVTMNGTFTHDTARGLSQVRSIAFDPSSPRRILVGTEAAGIIASLDGGRTWGRIPGSETVSNWSSFFFDEVHDEIGASSYGRGLWKVALADADLRVTKSGPASIASGLTGTFRMTVSASSGIAADTTLVDLLPQGLEFVSSTLRTATGTDACTAGAPGPIEGSRQGRTVTCVLGAVSSGEVARAFDIVVRSTNLGLGCRSVVNTAYVNSVAEDPDAANNTAAVPVTLAGTLGCGSQNGVIGGLLTTGTRSAVVASSRGNLTLDAIAFVDVDGTHLEALQVNCSVFKPAPATGQGPSFTRPGSLYMSGTGLVSGTPWLVRVQDSGLGAIGSSDEFGFKQGIKANDGTCGAGVVPVEKATFGDVIQLGPLP
jgi:hypothetical protein